MMRSPIALIAALGLGAVVAYFLDPARGHRRRVVAIDRAMSAGNRLRASMAPLASRWRHDVRSGDRRSAAQGHEAAARRDDVGRTGIWPASGPLPPGEVPIVEQGDLGTPAADRRAAESATATARFVTDPVCGGWVDIREANRCDYNGYVYYFHSVECRLEFDAMPERFTTALDRRRPA
ncbi:MAG TPA: hypothetical protein VGL09_05755 [Methylomirabilota bacterium]|jgi:YHS domain-containing protein